jgi:pimeloyl-ACP methyl ester carboxylesterase
VRWEEFSAPGRGVQLHVRRVVDPVAPPILLLHGLGVSGSVWQAFARRLLPHFAAMAPDLRGHGASDAPASGYEPLDYATDLAEVIRALAEQALPALVLPPGSERARPSAEPSSPGTEREPARKEHDPPGPERRPPRGEREPPGMERQARSTERQLSSTGRQPLSTARERPSAEGESRSTERQLSSIGRQPPGSQGDPLSGEPLPVQPPGPAAPLPVAGHSLGALVALEIAHSWPDLVSRVVLLDPPLDASLPNPEVPAVYRLRHAPPGELEAYLLERNPGGGALLAQQLARMFRQAADGAFEAMLNRTDRAEAPAVDQPTLVLQADPAFGGILGDAAAEAFVTRLPGGQRRKIMRATHSLHASHPAEVAAAIISFCSPQSTGALSST